MLTEGSDDQRRLLLAITLSLGLFLGVQYLLGPSPDKQHQAKQNEETTNQSAEAEKQNQEPENTKSTESESETSNNVPQEETKPDESNRDGTDKKDQSTPEDDEDKEAATSTSDSQKVEEVVLENEELKAVFSSQGARLKSLILKKYYRTAEQKEKVHLFDDRFRDEIISFSIQRNDSDQSSLGLDTSNWSIKSRTGDSSHSVTFRQTTLDGLVVEKTFSLPDDQSHMVNYDVRFFSPDKSRETPQFKLYSPGGIVLQSKQDPTYHLGLYGYESEGEWTYENDISPSTFDGGNEPPERDLGGPAWTGLTTKYFASIFIPQNRSDLLAYRFDPLRTDRNEDTGNGRKTLKEVLHPNRSMISYFVSKGLSLKQGEEKTFSFQIYNGPKDEKILNKYKEYGLPNLINYGYFGFISGFFMSVLWYLNNWIGNYGISILFLTLVVKLLLHPITKRAQVSMHKMKDLQPKIEELQEKYEDDRQKLGEEQMKLFKEHNVNPLGGCLPMLFQIPVLIGLYYGIRVSFQIRQESFMLWINDLSQPDHFMEIGMGQIMGLDFQYLNLLIIFMMATWLIQSLTHPSPSGGGGGQAAMQQKMFKFMPMIFGVICYNFPSGLVLYWMMSTLFSALEQLYIRKIVLPSSD